MKTYTERDMQFYPTPKSLAYKMLAKIDFNFITSVLEPSAGKGDIAEVVKDKFHSMRFRASDYVADIDCIEKDVNCAAILL